MHVEAREDLTKELLYEKYFSSYRSIGKLLSYLAAKTKSDFVVTESMLYALVAKPTKNLREVKTSVRPFRSSAGRNNRENSRKAGQINHL